MRKFLWMLLPIAILTAIFTGCKSDPKKMILLENNTDLLRIEEPVVLSRQSMEALFGEAIEGLYPVATLPSGEVLATQVDDLDADGIWDEVVFLATVQPQGQQNIEIKLVDPSDFPQFEIRTNVHLAKIEEGAHIKLSDAVRLTPEQGPAGGVFQFEGPGWENDIVGFRNYLDVRNGMDIFGKRTNRMVLDSVGINEDYHVLQPWGYDILRVGTSLGAGALAVKVDGTPIRLSPIENSTFEIVTEGAVRSVIRFAHNNWQVGNYQYSIIQEVSIFAGKWYYSSKVYFAGHTGEASLLTGITTIDLGENEPRILNTEGVTTVSTHGNQAFNFEVLGMAIMVPDKYFAGTTRVGPDAEGITNTIMVEMAIRDDLPVEYRFYSAWELSNSDFAQEQNFQKFLEEEAIKLNSPLVVSF